MNPTIEIVEPLLKWFYQHARVLPWREEATPYRVWVSEIMLQQTRVEAVKPYFERFIKRLPTIQDLAIVEEDELLKLWEGLGYYNRARNLQKAAQIVVECYQGSLPNEYSELMRLPGIGSYTAGAISSIAYQKVEPAVDGNVLRVIARVTANLSNILDLKVKSMLEKNIREIIPSTCPGDFNQALMELGATVCLPNGAPKCEECPWYHLCEARKQEKISDIPYKEQKKKRVIEEKTVLILQDDNKVAIQKRPNKGLLAGLYEFPNLKGKWTTDEVVHYLKELGYSSIRIQELEQSKHIFSHREWNMIGYSIRVDELELPNQENRIENFIFVDPKETEEHYPIPTAFLAYTKYLNIKLSHERLKNREDDLK